MNKKFIAGMLILLVLGLIGMAMFTMSESPDQPDDATYSIDTNATSSPVYANVPARNDFAESGG